MSWITWSGKIGTIDTFKHHFTGENKGTPEAPEIIFNRTYEHVSASPTSVIKRLDFIKDANNKYHIHLLLGDKARLTDIINQKLLPAQWHELALNFQNSENYFPVSVAVSEKQAQELFPLLNYIKNTLVEKIDDPEIKREVVSLCNSVLSPDAHLDDSPQKKVDHTVLNPALEKVNLINTAHETSPTYRRLSFSKPVEFSPKKDSPKSISSFKTLEFHGKRYSTKPWLDIPTSEDIKSHFSLGSTPMGSPTQILEYVDYYHAIDKSNRVKVLGRISVLNYIDNLCKEYLAKNKDTLSASQIESIERLQVQASSKAQYLTMIRKRVVDDMYALEHQFTGMRPGVLLRSLREQYKDSAITLDPCYRGNDDAFRKLYAQWQNAIEEDPTTTPSFLMWLETQDNLTQEVKGIDESKGPFIFNEDAKQTHRFFQLSKTQIKNGKLCNSQGETLHSMHQHPSASPGMDFVYAIDENGQFFIANEDDVGNHPYIIADGKPVMCAGRMVITDGKVTRMGNDSGHYAPTPAHFQQAIDILKKYNLFVPQVVLDCWYFDKNGESVNHTGTVDTNFKNLPYYRKIGNIWMNTQEIAKMAEQEISDKKTRKHRL